MKTYLIDPDRKPWLLKRSVFDKLSHTLPNGTTVIPPRVTGRGVSYLEQYISSGIAAIPPARRTTMVPPILAGWAIGLIGIGLFILTPSDSTLLVAMLAVGIAALTHYVFRWLWLIRVPYITANNVDTFKGGIYSLTRASADIRRFAEIETKYSRWPRIPDWFANIVLNVETVTIEVVGVSGTADVVFIDVVNGKALFELLEYVKNEAERRRKEQERQEAQRQQAVMFGAILNMVQNGHLDPEQIDQEYGTGVRHKLIQQAPRDKREELCSLLKVSPDELTTTVTIAPVAVASPTHTVVEAAAERRRWWQRRQG